MQREAGSAFKTTAASHYRLIGYIHVDIASNRFLDSVFYSYSGDRGSTFFDEYDNLTACFSWPLSSSDLFVWNKDGGAIRFSDVARKYDAADRVLEEILRSTGQAQKSIYTYGTNGLKSSWTLSDSTSLGWSAGSRTDYTFDASNNMVQLTIVDLSTKAITGQTDFHFNAAGLEDTMRVKSWNGTGWTIDLLRGGTYNAAGLLQQEVDYRPDGNGLLQPTGRTDFVFDGASRLITQVNSGFNNGNWEPGTRDTFGYTGAKPLYTFLSSDRYDANSRSWVAMSERSYSVDASSRWHSASYKSFNSNGMLDYWYKTDINYTADGLVSDTKVYLYDIATQRFPTTPVETERYDYEMFEPTSVSVGKNTATLKAMPNPVSAVLHIETLRETITWLNVYSVSGQQLISVKSDAQQLDVSHLPAGSYFLQVRLKDNDEPQLLRFVKL